MQVHPFVAVLLTIAANTQFSVAQRAEPESETITRMISNSPDDVKYYLCAKSFENTQVETQCTEMSFNDSFSLKESGFNEKIPTVILIHGYFEGYISPFVEEAKKAYLSIEEHNNVILVDWELLAKPNVMKGSSSLYYANAYRNVPIVGKAVSDFISFIWLISTNGTYCLKNFHLVGFDLGAHVAGVAGYHAINSGHSLLHRITGLDPTALFYQFEVFLQLDNMHYLDSSDAEFVDVIHTDQMNDGIMGILGHADFYPNGGYGMQQRCTQLTRNPDWVGSCGHNRAWQYFVKSITDNSIVACKCASFMDTACQNLCREKTIFGHFCPTTTRGKYYLSISAY